MTSRNVWKGMRLAARVSANAFSKTTRRSVFTASSPSSSQSQITIKSVFAVGTAAAALYFTSRQAAKAEEASSSPDASASSDAAASAKDAQAEHKVVTYKYVIVGAGTAGFAAMKKLRELDPDATILVVGAEPDKPYIRPPLSKELWRSEDPNVAETLKFTAFDGSESSAWLASSDDDFKGVTLMLDSRATDLDVNRRAVLLNDNTIVEYSQLLLAPGGTPNWLPTVSDSAAGRVSTYRTVQDFRRLEPLSRQPGHIVVIGGGFLGTELTCSLGQRGKKTGLKVTQVFPEDGVMALVFPPYLSELATDVVRNEGGATVLPNRLVRGVEAAGDGSQQVEVTLDDGRKLQADHVVLAVGIKPNTQLAELGDLEIDATNGGILVNSELQARTGIYAAGDVASYYDHTLGRRRVEHHDHAVHSGELAATNMAGGREAYKHQPFFWGDICSLGYEAVGQVDSRLDTVGVWVKPEGAADDAAPTYERGLVYYLSPKDRTVRGVLLWHEFGKVDEARRVIRRGRQFGDPAELKTQITLEDYPQTTPTDANPSAASS